MEKIKFSESFSQEYNRVSFLNRLYSKKEITSDSLIQIEDDKPFRTFLYDSESQSFTEIKTNMEVKLPPKKWVIVGNRLHFKALYIVYNESFTLNLRLCSGRQETSSDGFRVKSIYSVTIRMRIEDPLLFLQKRTHLDTLLSESELLHQIEQATSGRYVNGAAVKRSLGSFLKPNGVRVLFTNIIKDHESFDGKSDQQRDNEWNNKLLTVRRGQYVDNIKHVHKMQKKRTAAQNDTAIKYGKGQVDNVLDIKRRSANLKLLNDFINSLPAGLQKPVALMVFAHEHGIHLSKKAAKRLCRMNCNRKMKLSNKLY